MPVFSLRPDLEVVPTESLDGRPAFLVHDPLTGGFDRVEWPESDLIELLRTPRSPEEIVEGFSAVNTLRPTKWDVGGYLNEIGRRGWLRGSAFWPREYRERPTGGFLALFARMLFIQVPLLMPDNFLRATAGAVRILLNPVTCFLLFLCGMAGLYLALPRWEDYWSDSLGSFSLSGLPAFIVALIFVKTVHEFSHAYTAAMAGARVAGMGVAFFFFMPLPFTDVTDAWRLPWPKRLRVAAAGMLAEMAVGGVALLLWALSPPGDAAVTLARLSSVAVVSTLLTNLNPGPRFDGYYVLVCLFRMENLRSRSLYELRRVLAKYFFGVQLADAEPGTGFRRRLAMLAYACYAIFYRFSLGVALALTAYYLLPKAIGVPVAAIELWLFLGYPVLAEALRLMKDIAATKVTLSFIIALALLAGLGVWFFGEWPHRLRFPAVARSEAMEAVRTQRSGDVVSVAAEAGMEVKAGDVLALLAAPGDAPILRQAEWSLREAELSLEQSWRDEGGRRNASARQAEMRRRRVELDALRQRSEYLEVPAPTSGILSAWDTAIRPGVSVPRGMLLGWVTSGPVTLLSCYPDSDTAARLEVGNEARFIPDDGTEQVSGRVVKIETSRPEILEDPPLAAALGAVKRDGVYVLSRPYVKVMVELDSPLPRNGQTGEVWVWSKPESLAIRTLVWLRGLAIRESAF